MKKFKGDRKNQPPLLSVITIAFNEQDYITESIQSILSQDYEDYEYIIIDDGSTDATWEIITKFAKENNLIKAYRNKVNTGIPKSRNFGINLAQGKYIIWQDADDISRPNRLKNQILFMEQNPTVGICGGQIQFFNQNGKLNQRLYKTDDAEIRAKIFMYSPTAQPASIVRKQCFDKVGQFKERLSSAEDLDFAFRLGVCYQFANLPDFVLDYRVHEKSMTLKQMKIMEKNTIKIRKAYFKNPAYKITLVQRLYNHLQYWTIFLMPPKFRLKLFNFVRNTK